MKENKQYPYKHNHIYSIEMEHGSKELVRDGAFDIKYKTVRVIFFYKVCQQCGERELFHTARANGGKLEWS